MMELGATVCTRQNPACLMCPVRHFCAAAKQGETQAFPRLAPKQIEQRAVTRLWCQRDGALLLHRAAAEARRLALQHELPSAAHLGLTEATAAKGTLLATKKRGITRYRITESIYTCAAPRGKLASECVWVPLAELSAITLSGPHRRWITEIIARA
jgi:A/G-specific adenine glycosylase